MTDNALPIEEVCARLSVKPWTIYRYIREDGFPKPTKRNARTSRWNWAEIEAWVASRNAFETIRDNQAPNYSFERAKLDAVSLDAMNAACIVLPNVKARCGVYFLLLNGNVVYVGQTIGNIAKRVFQHTTDKEFDSFYYIETNEKNLDFLETYFILKFRPKYNARRGDAFVTNIPLADFLALDINAEFSK